MIQDIGEHRFDLSFRQPEARDEDYVLYMKSNKTLLRKAEDGNYEIPRFSDFPMEKVRLKMKAYYLFAIDGTGYYYVREMLQGEEDGYEFCPTSVFRKMTPMYQAFARPMFWATGRLAGQAKVQLPQATHRSTQRAFSASKSFSAKFSRISTGSKPMGQAAMQRPQRMQGSGSGRVAILRLNSSRPLFCFNTG